MGLAIGICVVGFVVPIVAAPLLLGAAFTSMIASMATGDMTGSPPAAPPPKAAVKPSAVAKAPASRPAPAPQSPPAPAASATSPSPPVAASSAAPPSPQPAMPAPVPPVPSAQPAKEAAPAARKEAAPGSPAPAPEKPEVPQPKKVEEPYSPWARAPMSGPAFTPAYNDVMTAVHRRDYGGVAELLAHGWWPDLRDSLGRTPLVVAAGLGDARIVEALLKAGADPDAAGAGQSAMAIAQRRGDKEMIAILRRFGAH